MPGRIDLPQLLDADAVFLRLAPFVSLKRAIICLDSEPRAPSANIVYLPRNSMPRVKDSLRLAVAADAHVAGGDAEDFALVAEQDFRRGETGIDFYAELFGFGAELAADVAQRAHEIAVIAHQRRHQEVWQPDAVTALSR